MKDAEAIEVLRFLIERDMAVDMFYFDTDDGISIAENCNDLFYWACADAEDITPSDLPLLHETILDCERVLGVGGSAYAGTVYACRKRKMRPQYPCYPSYPKELWPLFDAAGPERPEKEAGNRLHAEQKYEERKAWKVCEHCHGRGRA
jgi:hypothetical protein